MKTAVKVLAALMVASLSSYATAACKCSCVNGQIEAVCQLQTDLPPVCAPHSCTAKPLHAALISADKTPAGTPAPRQCRETLVLNPQTGAYISKQVCQ
ncbi:MAG TPA: hypothetical protein VFV97_06030 [Rhodanobacteraceae bacterium]|nr:hypothetical protein [Rhodanobacteraceae bacterium]